MGDEGVFQLALIVVCFLLQAQEFEIHRVFDNLHWRLGDSLLAGDGEDGFLVVALQKALIQERILLPFQLTGRPAVVDRFKFVIFPFVGV